MDQANKSPKTNKKESQRERGDTLLRERGDPLYSEIPEWLQEFRENLVDDEIPQLSGVLSKSSRGSIRPLLLDCKRLHHTDVDQYRGCHFNVHIDYGRLYHHDDDYHRNRRPAAMDVSPRSSKSPRSPAPLGYPSSPTGSAGPLCVPCQCLRVQRGSLMQSIGGM